MPRIASLAVVVLAFVASVVAVRARPVAAPLDPVGVFKVTTSTDDGDLVTGTLTIRAENGGYVGEFASKTLGKVPVTDIATSGTHLLGIFNFDDGKAVLDLRLDPDGALSGTWYRFGDGLPITIKK